jgi:hypothetical protein
MTSFSEIASHLGRCTSLNRRRATGSQAVNADSGLTFVVSTMILAGSPNSLGGGQDFE